MTNERKISKNDLISIHNTMVAYKRTFGFMDFTPDGVFKFFDSNPYFDGVGACPITIDEIKTFIEDFDS